MIKNETQNEESAKKRLASDLLKNADKLLKNGDFDGALHEIEKALEIDPGNFYARAYKDRIVSAREQSGVRDPDEGDVKVGGEQLKKKLQAERQRAEGEKKRVDADRQRAEVELRRRALEIETRQQEEQIDRIQAAEERKRREEDIRRKLDEERVRLEVETRKRIEEEKIRLQQEIRKKSEEETQRRAEEETRHRREEEERRRIAEVEEAKRRREAEEHKKAEDEAKRRMEEELRKRLEKEKLRRLEDQAIKAVEDQAKQEARFYKVHEYLDKAKNFHLGQNYDATAIEILKVLEIDPQNIEAKQLEHLMNNDRLAKEEKHILEIKTIPRELYLDAYKRTLKLAWSDGIPTPEIQSLLESLGSSLKISYDEHRVSESIAKSEVYVEAIKEAWKDGGLSPEDVNHLERMRSELSISTENHLTLEPKIRKELGF